MRFSASELGCEFEFYTWIGSMSGTNRRLMAAYAATIQAADQAKALEALAMTQRGLAEARKQTAFAAFIVDLAEENGLDKIAPIALVDTIRQVASLCIDSTAANTEPFTRTNNNDRGSRRRVSRANTPAPGDENLIYITVRASKNVGFVKKQCLLKNNQCWHGRKGIWHGWATRAGIDELCALIGNDRISGGEIISNDPPSPETDAVMDRGSTGEPPIPPDTEHVDGEIKVSKTVVDRPTNNSLRPRSPIRQDTQIYQYATIAQFDSTIELSRTPDYGIVKLMLQVVEVEGPVHQDEIFARIRAAYKLTKISKKLYDKLENILQTIDAQYVEGEDKFFLLKCNILSVRDRRDASLATRHYNHLSLAELRSAIVEEGAETGELDRNTTVKRIARRLGYSTTSHGLDARINEAWNNFDQSRSQFRVMDAKIEDEVCANQLSVLGLAPGLRQLEGVFDSGDH